jgi:hypothetical protein
MPVVVNNFDIVVPSAESTPAPSAGPTPSTPSWSAELARKLDEQLRIAIERAERVVAD